MLEALRRDGVEAVAVCYLHAYRNPEHELLLRERLLDRGFEYVALSSELAPRIKALGTRMAITLAKSGGTTDGPLQIIVTEQDGERSVQLARPVRGSPPAGGKYRVRSAAAMRVAYRLVQGSAGELAAAGQALAESLLAAGYELTGELRLVLPAGGGAPEGELEVEVQLGIQP